jgi:hypothetical protein
MTQDNSAPNADASDGTIRRVGRQKREAHPDPEWLELADRAVKARGRGEPLRLSRLLDVSNTTVYRALSGAIVSPDIMVRLSVELGIRPPKTVPLDPDEWRAILVATKIRRAGDRARLTKVLDVLEELANRVALLVSLREIARAAHIGQVEVTGVPNIADVNAQIDREWERAGFGLPLPDPPPIPFPSDVMATKKQNRR